MIFHRLLWVGIVLIVSSGILYSQTSIENYLKPNGFRSGHFFVGSSGASIKTGIGTLAPNSLLDFSRTGNGTNYPLAIRNGGLLYLFDMQYVKQLQYDHLPVHVIPHSQMTDLDTTGSAPIFYQQYIGINLDQDDAQKIGETAIESKSLILGPSYADATHTGHSRFGLYDTNANVTVFTMETITPWTGVLRGGSTGGTGPKLFAESSDGVSTPKTVQLGFETVNGTDYFVIYIDSQALYIVKKDSALVVNDVGIDQSKYKMDVDTSQTNGPKTFVIDHPDDDSKLLVHSALEAPENRVFYYGQGQLDNGEAHINLPDYFESLTAIDGRVVMVSAVNGSDPVGVRHVADQPSIQNGQFKVFSPNSSSSQTFNWKVSAVRKDIPELVVEPLKSNYKVSGFGPYQFGGTRSYE